MAGAKGRVSAKYTTRVKNLGRFTEAALISAEYDLKRGLQEATAVQLYHKTKWPYTKDMIRSIRSKIERTTGGGVVEVGYDSNETRRANGYQKIRLNMKGMSRLGYNKTMKPSVYLDKKTRPKMYARNKRMHKLILGD